MANPKDILNAALAASNNRGSSKNQEFYVRVDAISRRTDDPDVFMLYGQKINSDRTLGAKILTALEPTDNQSIPKAGQVVQLQKAVFQNTATAAKTGAEYEVYNTQYYLAAGGGKLGEGFLFECETKPYPARFNDTRGKWEANVIAADSNAAKSLPLGVFEDQQIDSFVAEQLMPWLRTNEITTVTHDVAGRPYWDENVKTGVSPAVILRIGDKDTEVFGLAAINDGTREKPQLRRPTKDEVIAYINRDTKSGNRYKSAVEKVRGVLHLDGVKDFPFYTIPAMSPQVGTVSASKEKYLIAKEAFEQTDLSANQKHTKRLYNTAVFRVIHYGESHALLDTCKPMHYEAPREKPSPTPFEIAEMQQSQNQSQNQQQQQQQPPAQQQTYQQQPAQQQSYQQPPAQQPQMPPPTNYAVEVPPMSDDDLNMLGSIENDLAGLSEWEQQSAGFGEADNLFSNEGLAAAEKAAIARRTKAPSM